MKPSLDVIIVNWNAGVQLRSCLLSLENTVKNCFELNRVVIVDNASTDGSADGLEQISLPIEIIRNSKNLGFAAACNQGAKGSEAEYLLFLNPDTRLFPASLEKAIKFMEEPEQSDVGILGIQLLDENGRVSRSCARFPSANQFLSKMLGLNRLFPNLFNDHFMVEWDHSYTRQVDQVMGAFFLVRRMVFEELHGFDERFFVYFEEVDLSLRAIQNGWKSVYYADAQAYHKGGGTSEQIKATRLFYSLRSRILYSYKHFSRRAAIAVLLGTLFIEPFSRTILGLSKLSLTTIGETIKAYKLLWSDLHNILSHAKKENEL